MKTKIIFILASIFLTATNSYGQNPDTLKLEFPGNNTVIIQYNDTLGLEVIRNYNLNKIVDDYRYHLDSGDSDEFKRIIIKNESDYARIIKEDKGKIYIIKSDGSTEVLVEGEDYEDDQGDEELVIQYPRKHGKVEDNRKRPGTKTTGHIEYGLNNWVEGSDFPSGNSQYAVKPWHSARIGGTIENKSSFGGPLFLLWGAGIHWYNFKFDDPATRISKTETGVVFTQDQNPELGFIKSKLTASYATMHFVPMLDFSYKKKPIELSDGSIRNVTRYNKKSFRVGFGGFVGYRLASYSKYTYNFEGDKEKDKDFSSFNMNNFRYGLRAQIGYGNFNFFVDYDLNPVFDDVNAPDLNAVSFGFIF
ncbi:hypothetical protein [Mangrovivirga cuniculi]|uniref:Outer membrane protein beta-barrel domain-containing protein n=1 Tax=Mangrovivirga cuniculi TaxID=2715131 RepID=A0A4D7JCL2_9BACT|nr:hypothetical protein [Mangrovivirga cuniculi]QCK14089.1 hypothetical protein DCC35_04650 [Mangrovivirga cuniculi]